MSNTSVSRKKFKQNSGSSILHGCCIDQRDALCIILHNIILKRDTHLPRTIRIKKDSLHMINLHVGQLETAQGEM